MTGKNFILDSLSDLVNKQSGDEWNDGESVTFCGLGEKFFRLSSGAMVEGI